MTVDVEARREQLLTLRERLQTAAGDIVADDDSDAELSSANGDQHLADHATDMLDREIDDSLEENAERVIQEIDDALQRLDEGTYGRCATCGEAIPAERLVAIPYATLCVKDKRLQEHG